MRNSKTRRNGGFALVLSLWAVLVVLVLAGVLDSYVSSRLEQAQAIRLRLQDELDLYSTRSTVLYLLGTQRFTRAGLTTSTQEPGELERTASDLRIDPVGGEITLDGSAYAGLGRTRFALQDEAGLISLNSESQQSLESLLLEFGTEATLGSRLLDALADYRDANGLARLNGAEDAEYAAAGESPPANADLRTAAELTRVLGWRDWLARNPGFRLHDWLSVSRAGAFNPNVVPATLLQRLPGLDADAARLILEQRREQPFRSAPDFNARSDTTLAMAEDEFRFFPSETLQLRLWREGAAHAELLALQLTPLSMHDPWQINSIYRVNQKQQDEVHESSSPLFGNGTPSGF